jgi:hypothetical protein
MWCHRRMRRFARTLSRLPIRLRLTLAFTGVIALLLLVAGIFLAREFRRDLDRSIEESQHAQAQDIVALVAGARGAASVSESGERFAQIYARDGELLGSTEGARGRRLIDRGEVGQASRRPLVVDRKALNGIDVRIRAVPARVRG